jgi:lysophospholipase L1-like esterase
MFRLLAVALGLLPLLAAELICTAFGWGSPLRRDDPYVGFSEIHPLFVLDEDGTRFVRAESRKRFFAYDEFPARKSENTFRVFCLGGSTVQGRPYSIETSFPTWLELALRASDETRDWEVVNCGGISYASYRLVPILRECLTYEPDLFIICTGHNEFLEDRTYEHIKHPGPAARFTRRVLGRSRVFALLRDLLGRSLPPPPVLSAEVNPILDYNDSLKLYHRDDAWREQIVEHYEFNLRRMVELAREADVPLILIRPPSNLAGTPPFKSEHSENLTPQDRERFAHLIAEAKSHYRDDREELSEACQLLEQAVRLDPRFALAWYELGQCRLSVGDVEGAREAFWNAREEDVCPLRMIAPLEDRLRAVSSEYEVPLLDAFALLEERSRSKIPDDEKLVDHVHPSFGGHQAIALALAELLAEMNLAQLPASWETGARAAFRDHFQSLDDIYFHNGIETLKALEGWTQGRADASDAGTRFPRRATE